VVVRSNLTYVNFEFRRTFGTETLRKSDTVLHSAWISHFVSFTYLKIRFKNITSFLT